MLVNRNVHEIGKSVLFDKEEVSRIPLLYMFAACFADRHERAIQTCYDEQMIPLILPNSTTEKKKQRIINYQQEETIFSFQTLL